MHIVRSVFGFCVLGAVSSCKPAGTASEDGNVSSVSAPSVITENSRGFEVVVQKADCKEAVVESSLSSDFCFNTEPAFQLRMSAGRLAGVNLGMLCIVESRSSEPTEAAAVVVDSQGKYVSEALLQGGRTIQASWARAGDYRVFVGFPKSGGGASVKIRFGRVNQFAVSSQCEFRNVQ